MKRKTKFLVSFLIFVSVITLGMSGLYIDLYNSINDLFNGKDRNDELIVQKVSAYSSETFSSAIKNVGTVNVVDLTLANDITYNGDMLTASEHSADGSSMLYMDTNGRNLKLTSEKSGGLNMVESTFYSVDSIGGGHIQIDTKYMGIFCKNLIVESGSLTVDLKYSAETDGPSAPEGFISDDVIVDNIINSENVNVDELGYWDTWYPNGYTAEEVWNGLPAHKYSASTGDAVRVTSTVVVGSNANARDNPSHVRIHGGLTTENTSNNFAMQKSACGLKVGSDTDQVNDGKLYVNNYGGTFCSTGGMGLFSNVVELNGGTCEIYGSCGADYAIEGSNQVGLFFSDPYGFDGHFTVGANASVHVATPSYTYGLFSFCCDYVEIKGTFYGGCENAYYDTNGDLTMTVRKNFAGQPHPSDYKCQKGAIGLDIGDIRISGPRARAFLIGNDRTIMAGSDPSGAWGTGWNNNGCGIQSGEYYLRYGSDGWVDAGCGGTRYRGRIAPDQVSRIVGKNPSPDANDHLVYQFTHAGSFEAKDGALVLSRSWNNGDNGDAWLAALYCSGTTKNEKEAAVKINGTANNLTKVYLLSDQYGIYLEHATMTVGANAYVHADAWYKPTNPIGGYFNCNAFRSINHTEWGNSGRGGDLVIEEGGVMQCMAQGGPNMDGSRSLSIALEVAGFLSVKDGATLRANAEIYDSSESYLGKSVGINVYGNVWVESGAKIQSIGGSGGLRMNSGELEITGDRTYCNFVSRGGKYILGNNHGALSMGTNAGTVKISGGSTVECSTINEAFRDENIAAIHGNKGIEIFGNSKVICTNAGNGIRGYDEIKIYENATYEAYNVTRGIRADGAKYIRVKDEPTINIRADLDAIYAYHQFSLTGSPKISLRSTHTTSGSGIWVANGIKDDNSVFLDMRGGYFSISAPSANFGIGCQNGHIEIQGSAGIINVEGKNAGLFSNQNIKITNSASTDFKFYSTDGRGIHAANDVIIDGTGKMTAAGKRYGIVAGSLDGSFELNAASAGRVYINGTVNLVADATYGGLSTEVSAVEMVSGTTTGNTTSSKKSSIKKYSTIDAYAQDKGGFYATIINENKGTIMTAIGQSTATDKRYPIVNRVDMTGGPEEVWYFDYIETGDYAGMYTIQNYFTKQYLTIMNVADGGKISTTNGIHAQTSYFYIKKSAVSSSADYNRYIICSGFGSSNMFSKNGTYGKDYGYYCLGLNETLGTGTNNDFGTQINDNILMQLKKNSDGTASGDARKNYNQMFNVNIIVDLGDNFQSTAKSVDLGEYLDFQASGSVQFNKSATVLNFDQDDTGLYPFAYEIAKGSLRLDLSGANLAKGTSIVSYADNNSWAQRFRIVYSIGADAYTFMNVRSQWMVSTDGRALKNKDNRYSSGRQFIFENCHSDSPNKVRDVNSGFDSFFPTDLFGTTVTYKFTLAKDNVNTFVLTTAADNITMTNPARWTLYECNTSNTAVIGRSVASGAMNTAYLDKIKVDLNNTSKVKVYYLVLEAQKGAKFVGISGADFYGTDAGYQTSSGIAASARIEINTQGKSGVYAKGQGYGIRAAQNLAINGKTSSDGSSLVNVKSYGVGTNGKAIHVGANMTTSYCTIIAEGKKLGIGLAAKTSTGFVDSTLTIDRHSTIDAITTDKSDYAIKITAENTGKAKTIKISPSASVYTSGKAVTGNGSIDPAPVSTLDTSKKVYEVKFHFATVDNVNVATKSYGNDYFKTEVYSGGSVPYSSAASNYTNLGANYQYLGIGHNDKANDCSLYHYLPQGNYLNTVTAYSVSNNAEKFQVNYSVAGYNKIDASGELMFTAKYDMGNYENISAAYITSAIVGSNRVDVYPLKSFSLETYKIYTSASGGELTTEQRNQIKTAVANSDGDTSYTWSEVKYYIENMAPSGSTVYIKVVKHSLAFSTITVPDKVYVNIDVGVSGSSFDILRAVFSSSLTADMDNIYDKTPQGGNYPFEGLTDEKMLPGYDRIKYFYQPSAGEYKFGIGSPAIGGSANGLTLPLFHLSGDSDLVIGNGINIDNVQITNGLKY